MLKEENLKIFCVDDELFTLNLSKGVLANLNYHDVSIFETGEDCLRSISENPDIVFLDYNMEGLNGLDVLKAIKKFNASIYVVMLSANESESLPEETKDFGAFTFIKKEGNLYDNLATIMGKIAPRVLAIRSFLSMTGNLDGVTSFVRNSD